MLRFARSIPRTSHLVVLNNYDLLQRHYKDPQLDHKGDTVGICRNPCASLCSLSLMIGHTELTTIPATKMWQHVFDVFAQGSLLEIHCLRFLLGSGHIGTLYLAPTEIPDSRRKTSTQHKPYRLQKQSRHSEPPPPVWGSLFLFWSNFVLVFIGQILLYY